jgi:acyl dehydratase
MAIDPNKALGAPIAGGESSWTKDQIILYHLGIGAGNPPTDARELSYTYEKDLRVIPSFGVIPVFPALGGIATVPGLAGEFNILLLLHGEQDIEIHKPIPVEAKVKSAGKVAAIYDKGKAAVVVLEMQTRESASNDLLFTNRFTLFLRGAGGFGGDRGQDVKIEPPARAADHEAESPTLPQQALLYRLSGDKNPIHVDPAAAKMAGQDRPFMHGLCSFGIVCKAAVDAALGGDTHRVARYQARFAGIAFPGETIVTSLWKEGDRVLISAKTKERGTPVISNAAITLRG